MYQIPSVHHANPGLVLCFMYHTPTTSTVSNPVSSQAKHHVFTSLCSEEIQATVYPCNGKTQLGDGEPTVTMDQGTRFLQLRSAPGLTSDPCCQAFRNVCTASSKAQATKQENYLLATGNSL